MTERKPKARAHIVEMPERIRNRDTLSDPDYTYACAVTASDTGNRTAEQWARAVFEGAPRPMRWFLITGWVLVLRLRLAPLRSPQHILGWTILASTPTSITLTSDAVAFRTHLVVDVQQSQIVHATFLRFERRRGRVLWIVTNPIHRLTIRYLLGRAARLAPAADRSGTDIG